MGPTVLDELKPGDWLRHEALKAGRRGTHQRAEVLSLSGVNVWILQDGEPGTHLVKRAEILRWWNPYLPEELPFEASNWRPGMEFVAKGNNIEYLAVLQTLKCGWVSYVERATAQIDARDFTDVFRIRPRQEFQETWLPFRRISVYDRLRSPEI